ncbi:MAG TPA: hypothetical protein VH370_01740 [Humisphaera sp.]|jgi:hypothetical protein|nr:hypothetical protein [Humisphaera sp.]
MCTHPNLFWRTALLVGVVSGALVMPRGHASAQTLPSGSLKPDDDQVRVRGRVLDPDGKPLAGARLVTAPDWWQAYDQQLRPVVQTVTQSGADGRFEISFSKSAASPFSLGFGQPGEGLWKKMKVAASAPGLGLAWKRFDEVDGNGDIVLQLVVDLPMEGRIIDLEGRAVEGVKVIPLGVSSHILASQAQFQNPPPGYSTISSNPLVLCGINDPLLTDKDGRFRIAGMGRERLITLEFQSSKVALLNVRATTREGPPQTIALGSDKAGHLTFYGNKMELTAAPAVSVVGVVRDAETKKPLAGVSVRTNYSRFDARVITDTQGRYRLDGLEKGHSIEITAAAVSEPYVPSILRVPNQSGLGPITLDFELRKGIWITGKVTDLASGAPVPAEIDYFAFISNKAANAIPLLSEGRAQPPLNCETQPDGTYRLVGLPGRAVIAVLSRDTRFPRGNGFDQIKDRNRFGRVNTIYPFVSEDRFNAAREINVADAPATADFQLDPGATLHVVCVDGEGKPIGVTVRGDRVRLISAQSAEAPTGEFDIVGLSRGDKRLLFVINKERKLGKVVSLKFDDTKATELRVQLEPVAVVTGRLINPDGDPVKGGRLRVDSLIEEMGRANLDSVIDDFSESDGRFTLLLPPDCTYGILASHSPYGGEYKVMKENLKPAPGAKIDLGDFRVSQQMN